MATRNVARRRARRDELVVDDSSPYAIRYEGTREVLIARAGVPAECFDESRRCSKNIWRTDDGGRCIEVRRSSPHRFIVYFRRTPEECERRAVELERARKADAARRDAAQTIQDWPTDAGSWRAMVARWAEREMTGVGILVRGEFFPGFRFEADVLDAIGVHLQAVRNLVETGTIVADPAGRAKQEAELRAKIVAADPALARFMAAAGVRHG